jgi:hypothetical protein
MADLRPCLVHQPYSQADLCHYTLQATKCYFESTFAQLRYSLGACRPSKTTNHTMSNKLAIKIN